LQRSEGEGVCRRHYSLVACGAQHRLSARSGIPPRKNARRSRAKTKDVSAGGGPVIPGMDDEAFSIRRKLAARERGIVHATRRFGCESPAPPLRYLERCAPSHAALRRV